MKKLIIAVGLILNGFGGFSQISKPPSPQTYILFDDCFIPINTPGKFFITSNDSCQQLYTGSNVVYSTYYANIQWNKKADIEMTLTSPNCPVAESLPNNVKENVLKVEGIDEVDLKLVWNPPWTKDMMSEAAKLELNL